MTDPEPLPVSTPDEELVVRIVAGETHLFEVVMRRHNARVYRAVRAIVRDSDAEDVMQQAYTNAYAHLSSFEHRSKFSTWLLRIAVHEAWRRSRTSKRAVPTTEADLETCAMDKPAPADPEKSAHERQMLAAVEDAIDRLPEGFREVLVLRTVDELSVAETAEILEIPEDTVKTRLHRARALVAATLSRKADGLAPRLRDLRERVPCESQGLFEFHLSRCSRVVTAVMKRIASQ